MRGPKPPPIDLSETERQELEQFTRRHTTPQQWALRARIVLAAADGANNSQIARQLAVSLATVRRWRTRWLALQPVSFAELPIAERLTDAPRSGAPVRITGEQVCHSIALACAPPAAAARPISQWTSRERAAAIVKRGIVSEISARHAARLLTRGILNHT